MQESLYSAVFGALSNEHRMNIIVNNLANVNTTGFKKDKVTFKDVFVPFAHDYIMDSKQHLRADPMWPDADLFAKTRLSEQQTDFTQGGFQKTGNQLDLAIQGEGFFKIMTPDGARYTRSGNFTLDTEGQIVDMQGNQLVGADGPISLPNGRGVEIDASGNIRVGGAQVGRVSLFTFENLRSMEKDGHNLFKAGMDAESREVEIVPGEPREVEGSGFPSAGSTIQQGYLETANVEVVTEMVRMIETQRVFEAYNKVIRSGQEMDQRLTSSMGKPI